MVYKRFIKKDGKIIGPYLYKSVRLKDGSVKSIYVGQAKSDKKGITLQPTLFLSLSLISLAVLFLIFRTTFTGLFIYPQEEVFFKDLSISTAESGIYEFELDHDFFELSSLSISGNLIGESARVYLEFEDKSYLVGDFSKLSSMGLVGYAISEFESEQPAEQEQNQTSPEQPIVEIPTEQPVEQPVQEEPPVEQNEQTVPEQPAAETPAENPIEEPAAIINETEQIGPGQEQQIIPEPAEQPIETPAENLEMIEKPIEFRDACRETCSMNEIEIGKTKFRLRIEVNGQLSINKITYSIRDLKSALDIDNASLAELKKKGSTKAIIDLKGVKYGIMSQPTEEANEIEEKVHVERKFLSSNSVAVKITKENLRELLFDRNIEQIQFDTVNRILLAQSAPLINANSVWAKEIEGINITGAGESVCVLDTGVAEHNALEGRIIKRHCFCSVSGPCCENNQTENENSNDDNSHGTHVAGTIASNDATYRGIAPSANIIAVKVCDSSGYCSSSDMIAGVEYCANLSEQYNISAISISIGGGGYSNYCDSLVPAMTSAISAAREKGIIVSVASGNNGYSDRVTWPACIEKATTVMATDKQDVITSYSNRNSLVDLDAPGGSSSNPITSTVLNNGFSGKYGTSMATPHVSGAVALMQQYSRLYNNQMLKPEIIEKILQKNGVSITDANNAVFKRINVLNAINSIPKFNQDENSIENPGKAKIIFSESVDFSNFDAIVMDSNFVGIDTSLHPELNKPANITFYSLNFEKNPVILRDMIICNACNVFDYSNGTLLFSVPGFSNYSSEANSQLQTFDSSNNSILVNQNIIFFANYTSRLNDQIINGTCIMGMENNSIQMNLDGIYEYNHTFLAFGEYAYSINCSSDDFEALMINDIVNVTKITSSINLTLNGKSGNLSVLKNTSVIINAALIQPSEGLLSLYLNNSLINEGNTPVSNTTSLEDYADLNVHASYSGNENYTSAASMSWINVINDTSPPQFSNAKGTSQIYGKNATYQLNITLNDNIALDKVWIAHAISGNLTNYSVLSNGNEHYYILSNLSAGNYSLQWFANDSSGNMNSTEINLIISKAGNPVQVYINDIRGNVSISYGSQSTAHAVAEGNVSLYRDGINVVNPETATLSAKTSGYSYTANATGNENYTANSSSAYYLIVGKAEPHLRLYFNNNEGDANYAPSTIELKASISPLSGTLSLYQDNVKLSEGSSPFAMNKSFSLNGTYKINATYNGNDNYIAKNIVYSLTIQQTSSQQQNQQQTPLQQIVNERASSGSCVPTWQCTEWSSCISGKKTRTCSDAEQCGTSASKPIESIDCGCQASWKCNDWSGCINGAKTRTCSDLNGCSAEKTETSMCLFPAMPYSENIAGIINSLESVGKTIDYLKANALPFIKKPAFIAGLSASIIAILMFIFRNGLLNAAKSLKGYRLNVRFKIAKARK